MGAEHPLDPVVRLGICHTRKKERKMIYLFPEFVHAMSVSDFDST